MKLRFNPLIFSFLMAASALVSAAQWESVSKTQDSEFFIDQSSITGSGNKRSIDVKRNTYQGNGAPMSFSFKYDLDCGSKEYTLRAAKVYKQIDFQGEQAPGNFPALDKINVAQPNTTADAYFKNACAKTPVSAAATALPPPQPQQQKAPSTVTSLSDIANKIGIERSVYCYYAGSNLEMKNGYGSKDAAAVGRMVKIAYLRLVNTFPPQLVDVVSTAVGKKMSTMSNDDRLMAPLECSKEPLMQGYLKQASNN